MKLEECRAGVWVKVVMKGQGYTLETPSLVQIIAIEPNGEIKTTKGLWRPEHLELVFDEENETEQNK